jgi:uncharacterized protein (TIGR02996 family)
VVADDELLEACRLAPDDDAPRLVWADAVGGERGELVVIQCDLARGDLPLAEAAVRRRRERELLARHGAEWAGFAGFPRDVLRTELRRGFVEAIQLDARTFAEHGDEIFRRAPLLRSLTATGFGSASPGRLAISDAPADALRALVEAPAFRRLRGLELFDYGTRTDARDYDPGHNDEAARLLVELGALAHLRALSLFGGGLTDAGVQDLIASGELPHLETLWLSGSELSAAAVVDVLACATQVRSLALGGVSQLDAVASRLPPVTELHLWANIHDGTLGRSRAAATLEKLELVSDGELVQILRALCAFPRLRALDLLLARDSPAPSAHALNELATALPSLRRLWLRSSKSSHLRLVARAFGPQLEELVLGNEPGRHLINELQAYVAGSVVWDIHFPLL